MSKKQIAKEIAAWVVTLFLCFLFFRAGIAKFDDTSGWSRMFRGLGFATWFRIFIGVLEVSAGLLILWPRTAIYGCAVIIVVMIGAAVTQLVVHRPHPAPYSAMFFAALLLFLRWPRRRPALPQ